MIWYNEKMIWYEKWYSQIWIMLFISLGRIRRKIIRKLKQDF